MTAKEIIKILKSDGWTEKNTKRITSSTGTSSQTRQGYSSDARWKRPRSENRKLNPETGGAEISPAKGVYHMKYIYPVCIYPGDNSGYTVIVPDLPGCVTEGETIAEALEQAVDAASGWVLDELEEGRNAPEPSKPEDTKAEEYEGGIVSVIMLDIDAYAEKYGNKAVRKNCTIPAWLNTAAEKAHLNFSQILQTALQERLHLG